MARGYKQLIDDNFGEVEHILNLIEQDLEDMKYILSNIDGDYLSVDANGEIGEVEYILDNLLKEFK